MSIRLRLAGAVLRLLVRARLRRASDPQPLRRAFARAARWVFRPVPHTHVLPAQYDTHCGGRDALWIGARAVRSDQVILYLHGGGYIAGQPQTHAAMVARLARLTGMRALVPAYRLAPEHPLPAALHDAIAAFDHLLSRGYRADQIVLGGDSAGGGLALSLLSVLCLRGTPPRAVFAMSPLCDLTFSGESVRTNAMRDHLFPGSRAPELAAMVLGDLAPTDPQVSPLFAAFPNCPPVLFQVAQSEILLDDTRRMEAHLRTSGARVTVQIWPEAPHVWQLLDGWVPEARQALAQIAEFLANPGKDQDGAEVMRR